MDELLRELTPAVIGVLSRRGLDFATAEDAVQEALVQATLSWPEDTPSDPKGWLVTVASGPGVDYDGRRLATGLLVGAACLVGALHLGRTTDWRRPDEHADAADPG